MSSTIRDEARNEADLLVEQYKQELAGQLESCETDPMFSTYWNALKMHEDRSVAMYCEEVERLSLIAAWARHGDLLSVTRLPNQPADAPRPSKLYCEAHNPRRSIEARRAYQRDRRFIAEYEELISTLWSLHAHELPTWDIDAHGEVRRKAYHLLQAMKSPTSKVVELLAMGTMNQTEIAQHLRVSRQAVSAAIKRRAPT